MDASGKKRKCSFCLTSFLSVCFTQQTDVAFQRVSSERAPDRRTDVPLLSSTDTKLRDLASSTLARFCGKGWMWDRIFHRLTFQGLVPKAIQVTVFGLSCCCNWMQHSVLQACRTGTSINGKV